MKTEVLWTADTSLPPDDAHPYRSGAWKPQVTERHAWDLPVHGELPDGLSGVYLRNTENPVHLPIARYHPFDGDGMVHSISFGNGTAEYHNRFVRTDGFLREQQAGQQRWAGLTERPTDSLESQGWGARGAMKDASSTDVVVHRGEALTSFYMCGELYRLNPVTLETLGKADWNGQFPSDGVSAHTKLDPATGELLFFNYGTEAPYMHYGVVDAAGDLVHYVDIELPGPRLPHDMAFTDNFAILNDFPLFWDPAALANGVHVNRFDPDMPSRFGIIPRRGSSDQVRWFDADPTFVLHWTNAYEDGDEIVLDGFFENNPAPTHPPYDGPLSYDSPVFRYLDMHTMGSEFRRWRFNMATGQTTEETLDDRVVEFGMINNRRAGKQYRYAWNGIPCEGWFGLQGVSRFDLETGAQSVYEFPDGVYCSETAMAPRPGAEAEDDGWLVTFVSDMNTDSSSCMVFDAADPSAGPVATIGLPERISSGTHAHWEPAESLA